MTKRDARIVALEAAASLLEASLNAGVFNEQNTDADSERECDAMHEIIENLYLRASNLKIGMYRKTKQVTQ